MDSVAVYLCFCLSLISWFISARLIVIMSTSSSNTCSGKGRVRSNFFSRLFIAFNIASSFSVSFSTKIDTVFQSLKN